MENKNPDLPIQPDAIQEQLPLMEKKGNPIWKVIFILLLIVNVGFACFFGFNLIGTDLNSEGAGLAAVAMALFLFPLLLVDFIAVLLYVLTHHHNTAKVRIISYVVLILIGFITIFIGVWAFPVFNYFLLRGFIP